MHLRLFLVWVSDELGKCGRRDGTTRCGLSGGLSSGLRCLYQLSGDSDFVTNQAMRGIVPSWKGYHHLSPGRPLFRTFPRPSLTSFLTRAICNCNQMTNSKSPREPAPSGFGTTKKFTGGVQRNPGFLCDAPTHRRLQPGMPLWVLPRPARAVKYRTTNTETPFRFVSNVPILQALYQMAP